jgi:hypothetical protein
MKLDDFVEDLHQQMQGMTRWCTDAERDNRMNTNNNQVVARGDGAPVLTAYTEQLLAIHDNRIAVSTNGRRLARESEAILK